MKKEIKRSSFMIIMFVLVLVACSSLAYAGFTRQYNPQVSSFGISISSQENMMISSTGEKGTFSDYVKLEELVSDKAVTLTPLTGTLTTTTDETYKTLTLTDSLGNVADLNDRKYEAFDLYFLGSSDMNLYLAGSERGEVVVFDDSNADPHFTSEQRERLLKNLRIGILTYSTIYQTLGGVTTPAYSNLPIAANIYSTEVVSEDTYTTFSQLGYSNSANDTILATTKKDEVTKIRIVIWLEEDGLGELEAICNLTLSLRFQAVLRES